MSFSEFLKSHTHVFSTVIRYRKTYENYLGVIIQIIRKKYPIKAILRNGQCVMLNNHFEAYSTLLGLRDFLQSSNDIMIVSTKDLLKIKLYDSINNGDIIGVFLREEYRSLPVKGKTIIDIGANIGDSAIYFAMHGADKVIALEPYPKNCEIAKKNIELNNLSNKINLVLAGCSSICGTITIDPEKARSVMSSLQESTNGIDVPIMTLESILKVNNINSALLKMDCEGCEYEAILSSS
ncbi:MAG: FkbM family methyltransferase, partial [Nitrososphaeraceae archaeon]